MLFKFFLNWIPPPLRKGRGREGREGGEGREGEGGGGRGCTVDPLNLVGLRRQADSQHYVISRHRTSSGSF